MRFAAPVQLAVSFPALVIAGCLVEPPSPGGQARVAREAPRPDRGGGRFYARTDGGERRALELRKLTAEVTPRPGTVRTRLTMEVAGPPSDRVEAVIRLPVPRGAAVTRAVLWVNDRPMNGAFVERERARQIYRSIVERRRDPALVTWDGPGWVAVSIFPLEGGKPRRFELDWVEPAAVAAGRIQYRVPTVSDGERLIGRAAVVADGRAVTTGRREVVALAAAIDSSRSANSWAARAPGDPFHRILVRGQPATGLTRVVVVAETSAAMSPADRARQRAEIDAVLRVLPDGARATILAADWETKTIADDLPAAEAAAALDQLDAIVSAGALHLERALSAGVERVRAVEATSLLFVGHGLDAFGRDAVRAPMHALRDAGARLSLVALGPPPAPLADAAALTGGEAFEAPLGDGGRAALVRAVGPKSIPPEIALRGLDDWRALETVTGETVWLARALEAPAGQGAGPPAARGAEAGDLLALWDRARLAWTDRNARVVADRTVAAALTPVRALLVLETDADYARYGLVAPPPLSEREVASGNVPRAAGRSAPEGFFGLRAPTDAPEPQIVRHLAEEQAKNAGILGVLKQVDGSGVGGFANDTPAERTSEVIANAYGADSASVLGLLGTGVGGAGTGETTMGLGNLGTSGKGYSSFGKMSGSMSRNASDYGRGSGGIGRRMLVPDVLPGQLSVRGSLDKEVVRRIVRRHINEAKYCYELQLVKKPPLRGRISVQFTISAEGHVLASVLQSSTMPDPRVESCVLQAVKRWEFPKPLGGGIVIVSYPFVFVPGSDGGGAAAPSTSYMASSEVAGDPDRAVTRALAILAEHGPLDARVARIADLLAIDPTTDAENAAWTLDRRQAALDELTLVARLLAAAGRPRDAIRVLSERAAAAPSTIAAEMRALGADTDATEVLALRSTN